MHSLSTDIHHDQHGPVCPLHIPNAIAHLIRYNNNTGAFQMLRTVNPLSVVYRSPSLSMLVKEVDDAEVSSYRLLFTIPYPAQHELKLIGFTKDKEPIVEASWTHVLKFAKYKFSTNKSNTELTTSEVMVGLLFWPALEKIVWGFGVHPDTLDPTILNISSWLYGDGPLHVLMYTLNSDTWTVLGNDRLPRLDITIKRSCGVAVRNSLPIPFYISNLGNSLVISGNLIHDENRYICAWLLEVGAAVVTSWRVLFVIPSQNIAKLLGFTMEDDPIVEVFSGQEMIHTLQVYDRPSQQFHNVGIEGDGGSFFIGPYKESLILLNV
ncbi:hypothetical protein Tco_1114653 [Tanacetum coccineum]|uniref:F-box associated domain-containing protein n=1 Tax=Tanacetum coccineum TaxID=301880 RepID=A0ABQ5IX75_9ASTR